MNRRRRLFWVICALVSVVLISVPAFASKWSPNAKIRSGDYVMKVENLYIVFDRTGSMTDMYDNSKKIRTETFLARNFNYSVPDWGEYQGPTKIKLIAFFRTLGYDVSGNFNDTNLLFGPGDYSQDAIGKAIRKANSSYPAGDTPLPVAINAVGNDLKKVSGRTALVIFTDGLDVDEKAVLKSATALKEAYGDNICIYTVQVGNDAAGKKLLDKIVQIGGCGEAIMGDKVMKDYEMSEFADRVFLGPAPKPVTKAPEPPMEEKKVAAEAAPEVKEAAPKKEEPMYTEEIITLDVKFDFDKSLVKVQYNNDIQRAADFLKKNPTNRITLEGHTDNKGTDAYNQKLAKRRADAVKAYMVQKFKIDAKRIDTVGYGFTKPVAKNDTDEGRAKNRRVEAHLKSKVKVEPKQ